MRESWGEKKVIGMVVTEWDWLCVTKQRVCQRLSQEKHTSCCEMFNMREKVGMRQKRQLERIRFQCARRPFSHLVDEDGVEK